MSEILFDPLQCIDFRIHHRGVTYGVHKFVLCMTSFMLQTLVTDVVKDKCEQCCALPDDCITLPDVIGGVDISEIQFRRFLLCLYHVLTYDKIYQLETLNIDQNQPLITTLFASMQKHNVNESIIRVYTLLDSHERVVNNETLHDECDDKMSNYNPGDCFGMNWSGSLNETGCLHLANYFGCVQILDATKKYLHDIVTGCAKHKLFQVIWRILHITDSFHWKELREICITHCIEDINCISRPAWKDVFSQLDINTVEEIMHKAIVKANKT